MKRAQNVIIVSVDDTTTGAVGSQKIDAGEGIRLVVFGANAADNYNNPGIVQAKVSVNGEVIAELQPVDNMRSRNIPTEQDGIWLPNVGGKMVDVQILATDAFTADTKFAFVFNYEEKRTC